MVEESSILRYAKIFVPYTHKFGTFEIAPGQLSGKQAGKARTVAGPLLPSHYTKHLNGINGLGLIPLQDDHESAQFGCIDVDKYPMNFAALEKDCKQLPVTITKSKSGGAHIWLFTGEPVPAILIQDNLKNWAAALGFGKSEIFPKQIKRLSADDSGNWINLPYYGKSRVAFFDGKEQSLEAFLDYAESRLMNRLTLEAFIKEEEGKEIFHDGPPCLATIIHKGLGPGTRNMVMLNVGSYYKKKDPGNFLTNLLAFNAKYLPDPLPENEIHTTIAKSLQRKTYPYQCNQEPLCSACNRSLCLKRDFGVGGGADELEVVLTGLTKVNTDPPCWFINIDGVRVELPDINALIKQESFRSLTAECINKLFSTIKRSAWEKIVRELLETVEILEAPFDSSAKGQLADDISEFFSQSGSDEGMSVIGNRLPYIDRKARRVYFKASDLVRRLKRINGSMTAPPRVFAFFRSQEMYDIRVSKHDVEGLGNLVLWSVAAESVLGKYALDTYEAEKSINHEIPF